MLFLFKKNLRDAARSPRACKIEFPQNQTRIIESQCKSDQNGNTSRIWGLGRASGVKTIPTCFLRVSFTRFETLLVGS